MKNIKYLLEFLLTILSFAIFKILGPTISSNLSGKIFEKIGPLFRSREIIETNIKKAIPNIESKDIKNISKLMWNNYGRIFAEYIFIKDFRFGKLKKNIHIDGQNILEEIKKSNKQVIFISGHLSNFELMAMHLDKTGINLSAIYRPLNNIFLNKTMEKIRKENICKNQIKKGRSGSRQVIKNLIEGKSIALMIDQRVREGEKVKFFNNLATTTTIPAQLVKKYNCDLVPIYIERKKSNYFKIYISKPIQITKSKSIIEITEFLNKILEKMILKNIDQWIWTHDRWKN